jgi:hypothetical protein
LNEELLLDWGIAITVHQYTYGNSGQFTEPLEATIEFADASRPWLLGIPDSEGFSQLNWIRAGNQEGDDELEEEVVFNDMKPGNPLDEDEKYEGILGGTWSPYCLVSYTQEVTTAEGETYMMPSIAPTIGALKGDLGPVTRISGLNNVDVVLTSNRSQWTRCPVLEMQPVEDLAQKQTGPEDDVDPEKMWLRRHYSVDKKGRSIIDPACILAEANPSGDQPVGMGWFPGYAIDVGTGERLNMAFGEDSWLSADNGNDMLFNPSTRIAGAIGGGAINLTPYAAGQHWIYVFKNGYYEEGNDTRMPAYDSGNYLHEMLEESPTSGNQRRVFRSCSWVGSSRTHEDFPMLSVEDGLIPNDVRIRLRVASTYEQYAHDNYDVDEDGAAENYYNPYYTFSTAKVATGTENLDALTDALDLINVVPNPYYAYSQYETSKIDNRIKITNLPEVCTVNIYNIQGTLVRQFNKADPTTFVDWDLKNEKNVPIAGGIYIIHVSVPDVGERILKWFGIMRPVDLDNF